MPHVIAFADVCLAVTNGTGTDGDVLINQGGTAMAWGVIPGVGGGIIQGDSATAAALIIPAGKMLLAIKVREIGGVDPVEFSFGTTPGGTDVLNIGTVAAGGILPISAVQLTPPAAFENLTTLYLSSLSWGAGTIEATIATL